MSNDTIETPAEESPPSDVQEKGISGPTLLLAVVLSVLVAATALSWIRVTDLRRDLTHLSTTNASLMGAVQEPSSQLQGLTGSANDTALLSDRVDALDKRLCGPFGCVGFATGGGLEDQLDSLDKRLCGPMGCAGFATGGGLEGQLDELARCVNQSMRRLAQSGSTYYTYFNC